jgi:hypothetical protein
MLKHDLSKLVLVRKRERERERERVWKRMRVRESSQGLDRLGHAL